VIDGPHLLRARWGASRVLTLAHGAREPRRGTGANRYGASTLPTGVLGVLDTLRVRAAILGAEGSVIAMNRAWRSFAKGGASRGDARPVAALTFLPAPAEFGGERTARAIADVLAGRSAERRIQYRWWGPRGERWFRLCASAIGSDGPSGALLVHEDVRRATHALRAVARREERLCDEERRHISRELHDTTAQNLSAAVLNLSRLAQLLGNGAGHAASVVEETLALCSRSMEEIRTLSYQLDPPVLEQGLPAALAWYADVFSRRSGVEVHLALPPRTRRMARELESALFRVAQEALSNVHRHARGTRAMVRLAWSRRSVRLEIEDNGRGFAPRASLDEGRPLSGKGLQGMRDRIHAVGGELHITRPGGTLVRAVVPTWRRTDGQDLDRG
jgi:two-component system, NarL family, sensor kinase